MHMRRRLVLGLLLVLGGLPGCGFFTGNEPPVAVLEASPTRGDAPLTVEFDGTRSRDSDGLIVRFLWEFGDGARAEGPKATHTYTANGIYLATLTVIDQFGAKDTDKVRIVVGNPPPQAIITATPTSGWPPLTVTFDASPSFDPEGDEIMRYEWEFGDGTRGLGPRISHTYTGSGRYMALLTITDRDGASSTARLEIRALGFRSARDVRIGRSPTAALSGDLDGDGQIDLVVANSESNEVSLLFGSSGLLREDVRVEVGRRPVALAMGDFNGDGRPDLVTANLDGGSLSVLLGEGNRRFRLHDELRIGRWASAVLAADVDRDGRTDLVTADAGNDRLVVLLGDGRGGFERLGDVPTGRWPAALVSGDFNGDGRPDLAVAHFMEDTISVLLGNGVGGFREGGIYPAGLGPTDLVAADFNGDGRLDLAVGAAQSRTITVFLGDGRGELERMAPVSFGAGVQAVAAVDFDGDGAPDLATANGGADTITVLLNDGFGRFPSRQSKTISVLGSPTALAVGDFDGDGSADLAVVRFDSESLSLLVNEL
jgi:hypothetical protein